MPLASDLAQHLARSYQPLAVSTTPINSPDTVVSRYRAGQEALAFLRSVPFKELGVGTVDSVIWHLDRIACTGVEVVAIVELLVQNIQGEQCQSPQVGSAPCPVRARRRERGQRGGPPTRPRGRWRGSSPRRHPGPDCAGNHDPAGRDDLDREGWSAPPCTSGTASVPIVELESTAHPQALVSFRSNRCTVSPNLPALGTQRVRPTSSSRDSIRVGSLR